jgi:hypothetical protein
MRSHSCELVGFGLRLEIVQQLSERFVKKCGAQHRFVSSPRIAADEKRNSVASFRLFAGSELSLGTVLGIAISES